MMMFSDPFCSFRLAMDGPPRDVIDVVMSGAMPVAGRS